MKIFHEIRDTIRLIGNFVSSEFFIWILFSAIINGKAILYFAMNFGYYRFNSEYFIDEYYTGFLFGIFILFFPTLFWQIYGYMPFEYLRRSRLERKIFDEINASGSDPAPGGFKAKKIYRDLQEEIKTKAIDLTMDHISETAKKNAKGENVLDWMIEFMYESKILADGIYSRAGVYLLVGAGLAIMGVLYFSFSNHLEPAKDLVDSVFFKIQRYGVLISIEVLAFFFLRQYKSALNEFRYYESVARLRQSHLIIYLLQKEKPDDLKLDAIIREFNFFIRPGHLAKGESTELLEASRLDVNELEFAKEILVSALAQARKKERGS